MRMEVLAKRVNFLMAPLNFLLTHPPCTAFLKGTGKKDKTSHGDGAVLFVAKNIP